MMLRTHLAISALAILLFLPHLSSIYCLIFIPVVLIATALPDIDSGFSTVGRMKAGRIVQFFVRHRGLFHSFSFCIAIALLFAFFVPILALPFFLGYGLHLFADSFTLEGIKPFWPWKLESKWHFRTGSYHETSFFIFLVIADILVLILLVARVF